MMKSAEGIGARLLLLVYTGDRAISKATLVPVSVNSGTEKEPEPGGHRRSSTEWLEAVVGARRDALTCERVRLQWVTT
jgi:hypothetical protein